MNNANSRAITNRQQKVLKFFKVIIPSNCSLDEASNLIDQVFSNPEKERLWRQYVEKTGDVDRDSSELKPYNCKTLGRVKLAYERPPTATQKKKIEKYFSVEEALIMLDDPDFTKEDAAFTIEDVEFNRELEKEQFDDQVFNIRYEFLNHEREHGEKRWKNHNMRKPKVVTVKEAIRNLNKEMPSWDNTQFRTVETKADYNEKKEFLARRENRFFEKCKEIDPMLVLPKAEPVRKAGSHMTLFLIGLLVLWVIYKLFWS